MLGCSLFLKQKKGWKGLGLYKGFSKYSVGPLMGTTHNSTRVWVELHFESTSTTFKTAFYKKKAWWQKPPVGSLGLPGEHICLVTWLWESWPSSWAFLSSGGESSALPGWFVHIKLYPRGHHPWYRCHMLDCVPGRTREICQLFFLWGKELGNN